MITLRKRLRIQMSFTLTMHSRPSIKDIARIAQVAPSTVSRALAGSERISDDTRQRVQTIANELGYSPSLAARSLVTGASQSIAIVAPSLADPFLAAVMRGIESESLAAGYFLVVASTSGEAGREIEAVRMVLGQQPDGLIVLSSRAGKAYQEVLPGLDIPVVFVNSDQPGEQVFSIATDNEYGGWLATRHLLDLGHTRIAYLGGPAQGRSHQARAAGYRRALQEAGQGFDPLRLLAGDGSIAAGRRTLDELAGCSPKLRPTALFCYNDLSALGLLAEAHHQRLHLPDQLSVVGFDNLPYAELSLPPLTTVDQRKEELGRLAVTTVLAARRGEPAADIRLRGDLIVRNSTCNPVPRDVN